MSTAPLAQPVVEAAPHVGFLQTLENDAVKVVKFLTRVGQDAEKGITIAAPYISDISALVSLSNPALGLAISTVGSTVVLVEQKFAAIGKQSGTGEQKAADVLAVAGPVLSDALAKSGHASGAADVQKYIDLIVTLLNKPVSLS